MNRALRRAMPIAVAAAATLVLAGCAGGESPEPTESASADAATCYEPVSGASSDSVEVAGDFGTVPVPTFTTPVEAGDLETSVVIEGEDGATEAGDVANVIISMFNGTTGEQLVSQPATLGMGDETLLEAFRSAIDCQPFGTRTVTVAPPGALYGDTGNESIGVGAEDSVVIVADVVSEYVEPEPEPLPTPGEWTENVPEVELGDAPVVTIPDAGPSTELQLKVLEEGDGAEVQDGDQVTVQYQGINWDTKEVFDQSYGGEPATFGTGDVITGFGAALVGQQVGSTVLVTIPPALGYGTEESSNGLGGHTLVFLVEIVDTASE